MLSLRLETSACCRRRLDGILQRLVVKPPARLQMPVLVGCFVDSGNERVGEPVIKARALRLSRQLAELARHDVVFAKQALENLEQRSAAVPNFSATMITATIGTHGLRALWAK